VVVKIIQGNTLDALKQLEDGSVQCCVTSPPYWGLRSYLPADDPLKHFELGRESTPEEYVENMVAVFREVRRVLRDDGVLWLNLGDTYAGSGRGPSGHNGVVKNQVRRQGFVGTRGRVPPGFKRKDLVGIPWRVAFALQASGWWLRSDIIWHKVNPVPESVKDRCTRTHEYVFMLTKSAKYFYDAEAVKEQSAGQEQPGPMRNRRDVWTIATKPCPGAHFATMPPKLAELCIKAGTSSRGCCPECGAPWERVLEKVVTVSWKPTCSCTAGDPVPCTVLDPFGGAGTTGLVAERLTRNSILIELNPEYCKLAEERIKDEGGMWAEVTLLKG